MARGYSGPKNHLPPPHYKADGPSVKCRGCGVHRTVKNTDTARVAPVGKGRSLILRYLCRKCYRRAQRERKRGETPTFFLRKIPLKTQTCWACDKPLSGMQRIYCSQRCGAKYWRLGMILRKGGLLTMDEYRALYRKQNNKCAICARTTHDRLCIDHNHARNRPRGLLCRACNLGIGNFGESSKRMLSAIRYLQSYSMKKGKT